MPTTHFTQQDGLFIDEQLHMFIEKQFCAAGTLPCDEVYQVLATLVDEFGCQCRKNKHADNDTLAAETLLNAYQQKQTHPQCHVDAQTTDAVLDEFCCQVPAIIVVALMDTLSHTTSSEPNAKAIYERAAQLCNQQSVYRSKLDANAA